MVNINVGMQMYHSKNTGQDWVNTGAAPWNMIALERDYLEPLNVFMGRMWANVDHLQWSPNNGVNWLDRSTPAGAVNIVCIQVVG